MLVLPIYTLLPALRNLYLPCMTRHTIMSILVLTHAVIRAHDDASKVLFRLMGAYSHRR